MTPVPGKNSVSSGDCSEDAALALEHTERSEKCASPLAAAHMRLGRNPVHSPCLNRLRWWQMFQCVGLKTWVTFVLLVGSIAGVGLFTFGYAEGLSYLSIDPKACANCHIMREQYDSWQKSSHHAHAVCVDCHLPHDFIPKMLAKADNGYRHSKAFTFQNFHEPVQLIERSAAILQANCERCHADMVCEIRQRGPNPADRASCVKCHASVGHGLAR